MKKGHQEKNNPHSIPTTFQVAKAVGGVTFTEIVSDRVLYNILVFAFLLLGMSFLASRLSFMRQERIITDFGLAAVSLSCCMIGVLAGSNMLAKEFDRRTIYVALCHPISRGQFLLGKFLGLVAVLAANWALLSFAYLTILVSVSDNGFGSLNTTLFIALFFSFLQSVVLSSISVFFSTFSTTSLSIMISLGFYLIGNNISQLRLVAARLKSPLGSFSLSTLAALLPNLEYFNLGTKVTYGLSIGWRFVSASILYGLFVIGSLLLVSGFLIRGREV